MANIINSLETRRTILKIWCELCIYVTMVINIFVLMRNAEIQSFWSSAEGTLLKMHTNAHNDSLKTRNLSHTAKTISSVNIAMSVIALVLSFCFYVGVSLNKANHLKIYRVLNILYIAAGLAELIGIATGIKYDDDDELISCYQLLFFNKSELIGRLLLTFLPSYFAVVLVSFYLRELERATIFRQKLTSEDSVSTVQFNNADEIELCSNQ